MFEEAAPSPGPQHGQSDDAVALAGPASERCPLGRRGVLTDSGFEALPDVPPSAELAADLSQLDLSAHSDCELFEILRAWTRVESWVAAHRARVIATAAPCRSISTPEGYGLCDPEREAVAVALKVSPRAAENDIGLARALVDTNQQTIGALEVGAITPRGARVIIEETCELSVEDVAAVESRVLERATNQTPPEIRRAVRRAVHSICPRAEESKAQRAVQDRCVMLSPASSGMAYLEAYLPANEAQVIYNTLTEAAHSAKVRDRQVARDGGFDPSELAPIDVYRADALVALATSEIPGLVQDGTDLSKIQAHVVLDLSTALGLADNPAELRGYGPIPGAVARELASSADWQRWLRADEEGHLVDVGTRRYRPNARLRELITARDQRCRFPGCSYPAERCDIDHAVAWDDGGATEAANLGALCRRHHRLKTHTRWELIDSAPDGTATWLTPSGKRIKSRVEPLLPEPPDEPDTDP